MSFDQMVFDVKTRNPQFSPTIPDHYHDVRRRGQHQQLPPLRVAASSPDRVESVQLVELDDAETVGVGDDRLPVARNVFREA